MILEPASREFQVVGYAISATGLEFALAFGSQDAIAPVSYLLAVALGFHLYLRAETPPSKVAYRNALLGFFVGTVFSWFVDVGFQVWVFGLPVDIAVIRTTPVALWHASGAGIFLAAGYFALGFSLYVWDSAFR